MFTSFSLSSLMASCRRTNTELEVNTNTCNSFPQVGVSRDPPGEDLEVSDNPPGKDFGMTSDESRLGSTKVWSSGSNTHPPGQETVWKRVSDMTGDTIGRRFQYIPNIENETESKVGSSGNANTNTTQENCKNTDKSTVEMSGHPPGQDLGVSKNLPGKANEMTASGKAMTETIRGRFRDMPSIECKVCSSSSASTPQENGNNTGKSKEDEKGPTVFKYLDKGEEKNAFYRVKKMLGDKPDGSVNLIELEERQESRLMVRKEIKDGTDEAIAMEHLKNTQVIPVLYADFVCSKTNKHYLFMEYIEGVTLKNTVAILKQIPHEYNSRRSLALVILEKLSAAIAKIHKYDWRHMDLTEENVIIQNKDGEIVIRVWLIDFGLSEPKTKTQKDQQKTQVDNRVDDTKKIIQHYSQLLLLSDKSHEELSKRIKLASVPDNDISEIFYASVPDNDITEIINLWVQWEALAPNKSIDASKLGLPVTDKDTVAAVKLFKGLHNWDRTDDIDRELPEIDMGQKPPIKLKSLQPQ